MPHGAVGDHCFGTFGFAGHSNHPRPPQPGHGTIVFWGDSRFMPCIPGGGTRRGVLRPAGMASCGAGARPQSPALPPTRYEKPPNHRL
jgi:hypothetical protein